MAGAYLVTLPVTTGTSLYHGINAFVIWANDATDAKDAARGKYGSDGMDTAWASATATALAAATDLSGYQVYVAIPDAAAPLQFQTSGQDLSASAAAINSGNAGTTYTANDVVTLSGGTFTRAATVKVLTVNTGVPATVAVVDPGDYSVAPSPATGLSTTYGGAGSGLKLDVTFSTDTLKGKFAKMVTLLKANTTTSHAAVDANANTFTAAGTADNLGAATLVVEVRKNGRKVTSLVGAITDLGSSGAALVAAIPSAPVYPNVAAEYLQR